ncbi:MAG: hypothetical protein LBG48_03960 [Rickettsiales bacterium]|nr:hypothetical protein [Rickettsiales bacterium]
MKIGIFITVRLGSKRLPAKALLKINDKPIISYLISRMKHVCTDDIKVIICTTDLPEDNKLNEIASDIGVGIYHGDENNILKRHLDCAKENGIDFIINVDGDDILCEPSYVKQIADIAKQTPEYDIIKTIGLPFGVNSFGYSLKALEKVYKLPESSNDTDWGAILKNDSKFKIFDIKIEEACDVRLSLDYLEDFEIFKVIIDNFLKNNLYAPWSEIKKFIAKNPCISLINKSAEEKYLKNLRSKIENYG